MDAVVPLKDVTDVVRSFSTVFTVATIAVSVRHPVPFAFCVNATPEQEPLGGPVNGWSALTAAAAA